MLAAFRQFVTHERASGGPDHHRALAARAAAAAPDPAVRLWRVLCYVATYELQTGAQLWTHWPHPDTALRHADAFGAWLAEHWPQLLWRRERRAARSVPKLRTCLTGAARFAVRYGALAADGSYEDWWQLGLRELPFYGRYALIKVFETWRRAGAPLAACPDIRPAGGPSPRAALADLFPERANLCTEGGDRPATLAVVNALATLLREQELPTASWETVEILLCNFRVAFTTRGEYPGRRLDTDLGHYHEAQRRWAAPPEDLPFLTWRAELFPAVCLGERQGWAGRRPELGACFADHGYFWSDLLYDYRATTLLAQPVRR